MKSKWIGTFIAVVLVSAVFAVTSVSAQPTNGGFETGDTTGWTTYIPSGGTIDVVTQHSGDSGTVYNPEEGNYFALLKTDGPGSYTTLTQTIDLTADQTIEQTIRGYAAFDAWDYLPYLDSAYVKIYDSSGSLVATPWYEDVSTVGDFGDGSWTYWEWTAPTSDSYTLELGIANSGDSEWDSYALFDYMIVSEVVIPEFTTIAIPVASILGLLFFFNYRKRRRAQ